MNIPGGDKPDLPWGALEWGKGEERRENEPQGALCCHFTSVRMAAIFKKRKGKRKITRFGKDVEKLEPLCTGGRNANDLPAGENSLFTPKISREPGNSLLAIHPPKLGNRNLNTVCHVHSTIIHNSQKMINRDLSKHKWMNKM